MRVALLHTWAWPEVRRGGERYLHDVAALLRGAGHDVVIACATTGAATVDEVEGVAVHRLRVPFRDSWAERDVDRSHTFGLAVLPWLVRHRADLAIAMSPATAIAASLARLPTVFSYLGNPSELYWDQRPREARVFKQAIRRADLTTVLSSAVRDNVRRLVGDPPVLLHPGIRLERFALEPVARDEPPTVLFASWAEERGKGLDVLVAAFDLVLRNRPARLLLTGGGDPAWAFETLPRNRRQSVQAAVEQPGTGELADVATTYQRAAVTVLPSFVEAFGLVMLESLACGTPAVGSDVGGIRDILQGCPTAWLAPHADVPALAKAIEAALDTVAECGSVTEACRRHAAAWSWDGPLGEKHLRLYERVAARRAA